MTKPLTHLLLALLCCAPGAVRAHESDAAPGSETVEPAAVAAASSAQDRPQIELVVQREGADLVLYLDDYATNAPLDGLQVTVRSGTLTQQAAASGEGTYRIAGDLIGGDGTQPLDISIHGAGIEAQLQTVPPPKLPAAPAVRDEAAWHGASWPVAAGLAVVLVAVAAWLFWSRRERRALRRFGAA